MDSKKINVGITGCGHLGSIHAKNLCEICRTDDRISFIGVYDIDAERSKNTSRECNVKSFASFEDLCSEINTLIIATPTLTHFEIAKKTLDKNIHVFIEKPVTSTYSEAQRLLELSQKSKCKIQVGHVERFNQALMTLSNYNLSPRFIESHRLSQFNPRGTDVSVIQDLMIHDIDIVQYLVKSKINSIEANGVAIISDKIDIANARLTFENGCVANLTASRISLKKMRKMRIFQKNSYVSIDFLNNKPEVFRLINKGESSGMYIPVSDEKGILYEQPNLDSSNEHNPIREELKTFFESILSNNKVKVSLEEAAEAVRISDEIIKKISNQSS